MSYNNPMGEWIRPKVPGKKPRGLGNSEPNSSQTVTNGFVNSPVNGLNATEYNDVHHSDEGLLSIGSGEPDFLHELGQGQHISSGSLQHNFVHYHDHGCKCDLCVRMVSKFTNVSKEVSYVRDHFGNVVVRPPKLPPLLSPGRPQATSSFPIYDDAEFAKHVSTRIEIFKLTPEVIDVSKTVDVPKLFYEERPTVVTKYRVVMVDVERIVTVPVIKEVTVMKKIKVHKIYKEHRNEVYREPVIRVEKRYTKVQVPRASLVEVDEKIRVPVIKKVPEKVKVRVFDDEWIENPIDEYKPPRQVNFPIGIGLPDGHDPLSSRSRDLNLSDSTPHREGSIKASNDEDGTHNANVMKALDKAKVISALSGSPYVDNVMVNLHPAYGHLIALIVAKHAALEGWAKTAGVDYSDFADLCSKPDAQQEVLTSLKQVARERNLERFEIPTEVRLLADPGALANAATHKTRLNQRGDALYTQFLDLKVHDKESGDMEVLQKALDNVNLQVGEYASLRKVETVLSSSPYVDNVILHLDPMHDNCVALIVAKHAALEDWAKTAGVGYSDFADLCSKPEARQEVLTSLDKVAGEQNLEWFEIPTAVRLLADPSDLVTAAITPRDLPMM